MRSSSTGKPSSSTNPAASQRGTRARDGEVVDRPVHGEGADVAAREDERPDDVGVGREGDPLGARQERAVGQRRERVVRERLGEEPLDEVAGRAAACAVGERDPLVAHARAAPTRQPAPPRARGAVAARRRRRRRTRPRSRPCTCRAGGRACRRCRRRRTPRGGCGPSAPRRSGRPSGPRSCLPGTVKRRSASHAASSDRTRSALAGSDPRPRHSNDSRTSIVSSIAASASGFPSGRTTRVYWFSTSQRPSARWRRIIAIASSRSSGSNAVTTTGRPCSAGIQR